MNNSLEFQPDWSSSPGDSISDWLQEHQIGVDEFANRIKRTVDFVKGLVEGKVEITIDVATSLASAIGGSVSFWLNRQQQYLQQEEKLWLQEFPWKEIARLGWIQKTKGTSHEALTFFNVPNVTEWKSKYSSGMANLYFRKSDSFKSDIASISAWIRQGEILSEATNCQPWNPDLFEKTLSEIRPLTREKDPKIFLPKLKSLCAACGVAVISLKTPSGCKASGATRFINSKKAIILLSFRYLSDDQFWFTFFHEAGHVLLHGSKKLFIEGTDEVIDNSDEENEANLFAEEILIPRSLRDKLATIRGNKRRIIGFAMEAGISPGIVVGQLQYHKYVSHQNLNSYKRRYKWEDIN